MIRRLVSPGPVLTSDELRALGARLLALTTADTVELQIEHWARGVARIRENQVQSTNDGASLLLNLVTQFGQRTTVQLQTNQLDDASLREAVAYAERVARELPGEPLAIHFPVPRRTIPPVTVWHDRTAAALDTAHTVLATLIDAAVSAGLMASAFVGVVARSVLHMTKDGVSVSGHETDAEIDLTAWTPDGSGVGWAGQAAREWGAIDPAALAARAIRLAVDGADPVAIEPGRRTVIFGPAAVAQFAHAMAYAWDAGQTHAGLTPFNGIPIGARVMDERVTITSDPADPDGGYLPFFRDGGDGSPVVPMTWVDRGRLANLAYDPQYAAMRGHHPPNDVPYAMRLGQGTGTIESMIASCREGFYVNRVASLTMLGRTSGTMTGVTSGGCFLVKEGKIGKPAKNLRFVDSPFVFLNNVIDIGAPHRAALGYTPGGDAWPLPPVIVPPLMVRDFNFTMLADAI